jgi:preprotein translocase subunit SecD
VRSREATLLILIALVTALALWVDFAPGDTWLGRDVRTRLGLDLQGGTQVLLKATDPNVSGETMAVAAQVIERRVNGLGVSEAIVQRSGNDRIIVELPGVTDPEEAIKTLRGTGKLEFIDPQGQFLPSGTVVRTTGSPNPPVTPTPTSTAPLTATTTPTVTQEAATTAALTATQSPTATQTLTGTSAPSGPIYQSITQGSELDTNSVQPRFGSQSIGQNPFAVTFAFTGQSATRLAEFTSQNVGKPMCIVLDNVVFSCPVIQQPLVNGSGEITTQTREDAERIFNQLKYGALPVRLDVESNRTVSATLGQDSVEASIVAGVVGLVIVALFMLLYYRLPGLLATIALLIYTAISFALYRLIPVTLTLAGIAGFILSIGLAVDANVLIFARLKEELRRGKSLRAAVEAGFDEAWPAIRDSNASTLITCTILYMFGNSFGVSIIKGFALTLGLGIIVSLFTAITVTRTFLRLIVPLPFAQNPWMFELEEAPGLERAREREAAA